MEEVCEMKGFDCGRKRVEKGQNSEAKEEREKKNWLESWPIRLSAGISGSKILEGVTLCGEGG